MMPILIFERWEEGFVTRASLSNATLKTGATSEARDSYNFQDAQFRSPPLSVKFFFGFLFFMSVLSSNSVTTHAAETVKELTIFIGTYSKDPQGGIYAANFNATSGEITDVKVAAASPNASFLALHPSGKFLYAVNESGEVAGQKSGGISAFAIEEQTEKLVPLNALPVGGGLCHLSLNASGKFLLAAAYGGGFTGVWKLEEDGTIGTRVAFNQHQDDAAREQKRKPHAHQFIVSPDNRFAFAVDLGLNRVLLHRFDAQTGALQNGTPVFLPTAPGAGPRHLSFAPSGRYAYLSNELNSTVQMLRYSEGTFESVQTISTLPAGFTGKNSTAEIAVHPSGSFVYGSNRGRDSIVIYKVAAKSGHLTWQSEAFTEGRNPRYFCFSPDGKFLLAANQSDHSIIVFRVDQNSGELTKVFLLKDVPGEPVCLVFHQASTPAPH